MNIMTYQHHHSLEQQQQQQPRTDTRTSIAKVAAVFNLVRHALHTQRVQLAVGETGAANVTAFALLGAHVHGCQSARMLVVCHGHHGFILCMSVLTTLKKRI